MTDQRHNASRRQLTDQLLSVAQVARMFGVAERTVRQWADEGELPAFKAGPKLWRFKLKEVLPYLDRPSEKVLRRLTKEEFETLSRLLLDRSSKVAVWIVTISTLVLALPVLWQILLWVVNVSKK